MKAFIQVAFCSVVLISSAAAQNHGHGEPGKATLRPDAVGTVDFRNSCEILVRKDLNHAVAQLHSFWFGASRKVFEIVLEHDPQCAIAYWGIALTHWGNTFAGARTPEVIEAGRKAVQNAKSARTATLRERQYIDAVAILFSDGRPATHRARIERYAVAMEKLAAAHPDDVEAKIFWALAVAQTATPTDKTFQRQVRAGALLEPLFAQLPQHPGIAHYIIHAYDTPSLAVKALPAARAYADIAPAAPHALHMPSHTFTRLGLWQESVATNLRSADTADRNREPDSTMHALDYMMYAYLQMSKDSEAKSTLDRALKLDGAMRGFSTMAIPARYVLERQQWNEAAELPAPAEGVPAYAEAIRRFARAIGAARSGKLDRVQPELDRLVVLRQQLIAANDTYWAQIIDIQRQGASAWLAFGQGKHDEAIAMLRAAADAEDATDKSAVTPGPLAPAREMLGFMLLEANRPDDALIEFDAAIAKEPNRFLALYGAGRAAEKAGQPARAKRYFQHIVQICNDGNSDRPELIYARKNAS
jgi:tetratricopeptide (TPR) repeat protein